MNLAGLLDLLKQVPAYVAWLAQIEQRAEDATPQALLQSARAFVTAGLKMHRPGPLVLITARSEMAQQLAEHLGVWLPAQEDGGPPVYLFADPDALPYERIAWSGATRQRRLTALAALQSRSRACTAGGDQRPRLDAEDLARA